MESNTLKIPSENNIDVGKIVASIYKMDEYFSISDIQKSIGITNINNLEEILNLYVEYGLLWRYGNKYKSRLDFWF